MMPYLARSLSYIEYGTYGQVLMINALMQVIFTFSLNQMVNLIFAETSNDRKKSFATFFYLSLVTSLAGVVVLFLGSSIISSWFDNPELRSLLIYSGYFLFGQIIFSVFYSMMIFHDRIKQASVLLIFSNLVRVFLIFISIHFYHSLDKVILSLNVVSILQVLMALYYLPRDIIAFKGFDSVIGKKILKNAFPLTLSGITERGVFYIDGIIISSMLTTSDYAVYRAGAFEVPFISSLYGSVSSIILPEVARFYRKGDYKSIVELKQRGIIGNACLIYPVLIFLLFFGKALITFYLTEKYEASVAVFAIFNLALLIRVNDYQDILIVSGRTRYIFFYSLVLFLFNLVTNYILIRYFGIIGGAIAFIAFLFMYAGLLAIKSASTVNSTMNNFFEYKKLATIVVISLLFIQPFYWTYHLLNFNIIFVIGSGAVFLLSVYGFLWKKKLLDNQLLNQLAVKVRLLKNKDDAGS